MTSDDLERSYKQVLESIAARDKVIAAAKKVSRRCSSYRNAKCVIELKKAVEALEALEKQS